MSKALRENAAGRYEPNFDVRTSDQTPRAAALGACLSAHDQVSRRSAETPSGKIQRVILRKGEIAEQSAAAVSGRFALMAK
jgi:hypothetical protein